LELARRGSSTELGMTVKWDEIHLLEHKLAAQAPATSA
jgi:hypothetical protein